MELVQQPLVLLQAGIRNRLLHILAPTTLGADSNRRISMTTHVATLVVQLVGIPHFIGAIFLTDAAYTVGCANSWATCSPVASHPVLACCVESLQTCVSATHCIGHYDSSALCSSSGGCTFNMLAFTWWVTPTSPGDIADLPTNE